MIKKIFIVNTLVARQTVYNDLGIDLYQVQSKNEITKFIQNTGQSFPSNLLLKNIKIGPSRFYKHLLQEPPIWEGSITDLDDFKKDIIFTKEDTYGDSVFKITLKLKLDQNCTMVLRHWRVVLIEQVLPLFKVTQFLTDVCITWQFEVVSDVFKVELD